MLAADSMLGPYKILAAAAALCTVLAPAGAVPARAAGAQEADSPPTRVEMATLRGRVDHHVARVRLEQGEYDIRGVTFDSTGISFDPGRVRPLASGSYYERREPSPLSSPVGWDRIQRITVRKPCGLRGTIAGGVVGAAATVGLWSWAAASGEEMGPGALVLLAFIPVGAALGGGIGTLCTRSEPGWQRVGVGSAGGAGSIPQVPDTAGLAGAPSAGAATAAGSLLSSIPLGTLQEDIGRRAIRVWTTQGCHGIRGARLGPSGIEFDAGNLETLRAPATAGAARTWSTSVSSPIAWDQIDRLERMMPSARRGAAWGMIAMPLILLVYEGVRYGGLEAATAGMVTVCYVPVGALVGAGIGSLVYHPELEWDRSRPASVVHR